MFPTLESKMHKMKKVVFCKRIMEKVGVTSTKNQFFVILAKYWHFCHFGPHICLFGQFGAMSYQKTIQAWCLGGFLICEYQNFGSLPKRLSFLAPKQPNLAKKRHFCQISPYVAHLMPCPTKNANKVPRWFSYMWIP